MSGVIRFSVISVASLLSACSASRSPIEMSRGALDRNFQVTVESDGKQIKNFEQALVHRVVLTPDQIQGAMSDWPNSVRLPFVLVADLDHVGQLKGYRIARTVAGTALPDLGLGAGDVITGVGRRPIRDANDLGEIFLALKNSKLVSLTFERSGQPHKTFFFAR